MSEPVVPSLIPPAQLHHRLRVQARLGALHLFVEAEFHAPWTVLFGPSGSGKSTLLRAMAGLLPPSPASVIHFERREPSGDWTTLTNTSPGHHEDSLPAPLRAIAYAPPAASLFPHLSVADNVDFGISVAPQTRVGSPRPSSLASRSDEARELFDLASLWSRRPAELSGGEAQRVNLARAFARPHARLLLLDEPFSGLDRALRNRILPRLRAALTASKLPVISVTHDIEEAFLLGADILRLEAGTVLAQGPATDVLAAERNGLRRTLEV